MKTKTFLVHEMTVQYRTKPAYKLKAADLPKICSSQDAHNYLFEVWDADTIEFREEFVFLMLNRANRVIGWHKLSIGGTGGTVVDPKCLFSIALKGRASAIILAHNHPSGTLKPSRPDIELTQKIQKIGDLLDLKVLDHLIITNSGYYSLADNGDI